MRTFSIVVFLLFNLIFSPLAGAQNQSRDIDDLQRQMQEWQQRLMEQLHNSPFNGQGLASPQWDTTFYFRFDTTFENGSMSRFFQFSPFGVDSTMQGGFGDFNRLFDRFFDPGGFFDPPAQGMEDFPSDDGGRENTDDGLLPEERLRLREETNPSENNKSKTKPAHPKPDPKIKTVRI